MAVPNLPFMLSQANTEFNGNGWGSDIRTKARLPAAGWLSELAGKSNFILINAIPSIIEPGTSLGTVKFFIRSGTTYMSHNSGGNKELQMFNLPVWCMITADAGMTFEGCTSGVWFLVDTTRRGVVNGSTTLNRNATFSFSGTNNGTIIHQQTVQIQ